MESFRGFESACVYAADKKVCMTVDTEWDMEEHQLSDRGLVNALLDASEECLAKDQDSDVFENHTGWEEAVQGWGRGPSLISLFQMQRRGKRPKTWDADSHCLLCIDTKIAELHVSENARHGPEFSSGSEKNTKTIPTKDLKTRPCSTCSAISSYKNTVELLPKQNFLANPKKVPSISGLLINSTAATCIGLSHNQEDECPVLKDRCAGNVTLINCFAVLPPLKASLDRNVSSPDHLKRGELTFGAGVQDVVEILQSGASATATAGGNGGVDGRGEMRTDSHVDARSAEDGLHSSSASKYWTNQDRHRLLTAFSIPFTKRCDQVTYRLGRYPKQEDLAKSPARNNSGHKLYFGYRAKNIRRAEPELPLLFGTRVAIPASTHRL